jgi:hypothetical protein
MGVEVPTTMFHPTTPAFVKAPEKNTEWNAGNQKRDECYDSLDGPSHDGR